MKIVSEPISFDLVRQQHATFFERMVKIVVDLERRLIALDAEMHADLEQFLLEQGSEQQHLWGANLYFEGPLWIEFTSLINIRPAQGNRGMEVENPQLRDQIDSLVHSLILR